MKKVRVEWGDIFYSSEMYHEFGITDSVDAMLAEESVLKSFFDSEMADESLKFKEYVDLYGKLNRLKSYAILSAHGGSNGKWTYYDNDLEYLVQDWINENDGRYSAILISACNPKNYTPKSSKSLLFVPDRNVGTNDFEDSGACFSLIHPKIGEIDSYIFDYELNKLGSLKK